MVTLLTVTFPKAMLGKMFCGDVVKAAALLVAVLASPSRKVVVSLTMTDPGVTELILTATLLRG